MKSYLLFGMILFFNFSNAQIVKDYKSFCDNLIVNKKYIFKEKDVKQQILFIGEVTDNKGVTYKVLVSSLNLSGKGVNDLIFISKKNIYKYRMNLPTDMPFKISFNELYFKVDNIIKTMKIEDDFNKIFCTPFECFEMVK